MKKSLLVLVFIAACMSASAQNKFYMGFNVGGNMSRVYGDTFADNFSRRNRIGYMVGIQSTYDLNKAAAISLGFNFVNKGYKINNDTLGVNPSVIRKTNSLNIPVGVIFKQQFNPSSYIHEKAGFIGNFSLRKDSITAFNSNSAKNFRITDISEKGFYPMFYLGIGIGGKTENGDRYEFSVTYNQSFSTDANLRVEYGQNFLKQFPLTYRGGFLQFGFSYYFNMGNFQRSDEYFID